MSDSHRLHKQVYGVYAKEINKHHTHETDGTVPVGLFTTFPAFLRFVSNSTAHSEKFLNTHWQTITDRCKPCELLGVYDAVAKTETNEADAMEFLKSIDYKNFATHIFFFTFFIFLFF